MSATTYPNAPGFQTSGPETSEQAAQSVAATDKPDRKLCHDLLLRQPMTCCELAAALGKKVTSVRPRVTQLRKLGFVEDTKQRKTTPDGCREAVWRGVAKARKPVQQELI